MSGGITQIKQNICVVGYWSHSSQPQDITARVPQNNILSLTIISRFINDLLPITKQECLLIIALSAMPLTTPQQIKLFMSVCNDIDSWSDK